ncbi:MAG: alanine--tRNA ligase [Caldisericia bacterium]|nr:alanine--tRNA ligase [Caldisericia bacterium]MDD4614422.1 alanine--tRNA ligase [Caldisericia bacterium]
MNTNEIRKAFLQFFKEKDHRILDPSPLPIDDPTLLFTVAGMVPLKKYYLGESSPISPRMTSSQPCLRTNDIENVGKTPRHHTFFEMLGNFSIGDYFKKEAIELSWDLLTNVYKIDPALIWVTVFPDDTESKEIWKTLLPAVKIIESKDNFWQMAAVGPCGFDSEIHIDLGSSIGCKKENCNPLCDCGRFLEVWNLVFMEFTMDEKGERLPLPKKNIDTGMGLERISCVLNHVQSNYDTDLFLPVIQSIEKISGISKEEKRFRFNIIADHVRAIPFLISDGVFPENSKHGYVLRRLIRRAKLSGHLLGIEETFLAPLCEQVIQQMAERYPKLLAHTDNVKTVVTNEEEQFSQTLKDGYKIFQEAASKVASMFPGDIAFKLHDTYGFPVELTKELLEERGLCLDEKQFYSLLDEQKQRAKTVHAFSDTISETDYWVDLRNEIGNTLFLGYERDASSAIIRTILHKGKPVTVANQTQETYTILVNQTPLYPEKGGPIGDQGMIQSNGGVFKITRTFSPVENLIIHEAVLENGQFHPGDTVQITVDVEFRRGIRRAHTATHLLHGALKRIIGEYVNQSGSYVEPDSLRFDFNAFEALSVDQIHQIEDDVNHWIARSEYVRTEVKSLQQAVQEGATALFKEKYGEEVRIVEICDISKELCGGLHVSNTSELRLFSIIKEYSIGSNLRRIEAVVGMKAIERCREESKLVKEAKRIIDKPGIDLIPAIQSLQIELKEKDKEIRSLRSSLQSSSACDVIQQAQDIGGYSLLVHSLDNSDMNMLRGYADQLRSRTKKPILTFITSSFEEQYIGVLASSGEINCKDVLKHIQSKFSIRGGGNPKLVSLGAIHKEDIPPISQALQDFLKNRE